MNQERHLQYLENRMRDILPMVTESIDRVMVLQDSFAVMRNKRKDRGFFRNIQYLFQFDPIKALRVSMKKDLVHAMEARNKAIEEITRLEIIYETITGSCYTYPGIGYEETNKENSTPDPEATKVKDKDFQTAQEARERADQEIRGAGEEILGTKEQV